MRPVSCSSFPSRSARAIHAAIALTAWPRRAQQQAARLVLLVPMTGKLGGHATGKTCACARACLPLLHQRPLRRLRPQSIAASASLDSIAYSRRMGCAMTLMRRLAPFTLERIGAQMAQRQHRRLRLRHQRLCRRLRPTPLPCALDCLSWNSAMARDLCAFRSWSATSRTSGPTT